jgi:hypothetical protein
MISHWHVEAISTTKQEAKRKQKALDILVSARRVGFEINHQTCLATKQPIVWLPNTDIIQLCHHLSLRGKVYIAGHLGLIYLSPLMYYFILMQVTRYIVIHTRDSINQYHQRNNYTISLGWYHNMLLYRDLINCPPERSAMHACKCLCLDNDWLVELIRHLEPATHHASTLTSPRIYILT